MRALAAVLCVVALCCAAPDADPGAPSAPLDERAGLARLVDAAWRQRAESGEDPTARAMAWRRLAGAARAAGDVEQAERHHERALALWQESGRLREAALESHQLMVVAWDESRLLPALRAAQRARRLADAAGDAQMQLVAVADLLTVFDEVGDHRVAVSLLDRFRAQVAPDDELGRFYVDFYDGLLRARERRFVLSQLAYERALARANGVGQPDTVRAIHYNLVEVHLARGDIEAAEAALARAVAMVPEDPSAPQLAARGYFTALVREARAAPDAALSAIRRALAAGPPPDWAWQLHAVAGRLHQRRGATRSAVDAYEQAITAIEALRTHVAFDALKPVLLERKRAPYEALLALHAGAGRLDDALATAEAASARTFIEAFVRTAYEAQGRTSNAVQELGDTTGELVAALAEVAPGLGASPVTAPRPIAEVLRATADLDIVAFFTTRTRVWRYTQIAGERRLRALDRDTPSIERDVHALLAAPEDVELAAGLGALLVPPALLDRTETPAVVVADGAIAGLPLAALLVDGRRVVERRALVYAPSLSAIAEMRRAPPITRSGAAVLAPATADDLPGALAEAQGVARELGVAATTGPAASVAALRASREAEILHLASHGGIDLRGGWIALGDGRVHVGDVLQWQLRPGLAVLASCASGARPNGGPWGAMAAAFLAAGTETVLATLWSVDDGGMHALIDDFYAAGGAEIPAVALARAQRRAIARGAPVAQWAAPVLLGAIPRATAR